MQRKTHELTGRKFGRWTVLGLSYKTATTTFWVCRCDCENKTERSVNQNNLLRDASRSCGCIQKEETRKARQTHGKSKHPLYNLWRSMLHRCENPKNRDYRYYGARGIKVCERWHDFLLYLEDLEATWVDGLSLDRINNDGNYEPTNCRWLTQAEQARNTRRNILVESPWGRLTASECARKIGISPSVFLVRLKNGWVGEDLFGPSRQRNRWKTGRLGTPDQTSLLFDEETSQ
jgi:hypothetical protein